MSGAVRFGLIGCGRIGATADDRAATWPADIREMWLPYSHASAILGTPGAALHAVCDSNVELAEATRARFGAAAAYSDAREMLEREELDAVAIATRTAERPQIAREAVEHGIKALYCEKPLATTLEAADEISALLRERKVAFGYGTRRRNMEAYRLARRYVAEGAIGPLRSIVLKFGRGPLMWNHPHVVDIASFFAGDVAVESVQCELDLRGVDANSRTTKIDCDPLITSARIRFINGIDATILPVDGLDVELLGSKGVLSVRQDGLNLGWRGADPSVEGDGWFRSERIEPIPVGTSGTVRGITRLVTMLQNAAIPTDDELAAALAGHEILFACVESHLRDGARVRPPLERRGLEITGRVGDRYC